MNNFTLIIFLYVGKYLTDINTHSVIRRNEYHTLRPTAYIFFNLLSADTSGQLCLVTRARKTNK